MGEETRQTISANQILRVSQNLNPRNHPWVHSHICPAKDSKHRLLWDTRQDAIHRNVHPESTPDPNPCRSHHGFTRICPRQKGKSCTVWARCIQPRVCRGVNALRTVPYLPYRFRRVLFQYHSLTRRCLYRLMSPQDLFFQQSTQTHCCRGVFCCFDDRHLGFLCLQLRISET